MNSRNVTTIATSMLLLIATGASAQQQAHLPLPNPTGGPTVDVVLRVPLNLTKISVDIAKVVVTCAVLSPAFTATHPAGVSADLYPQSHVELPVSNGEVVTTATIVVTVPDSPGDIGKSANYGCELAGFSTTLGRWDFFSNNASIASFLLGPTPTMITGTFAW